MTSEDGEKKSHTSWLRGGGYLDWLPPGQQGAAVGAFVGNMTGGFVIPVVGGIVGAPVGAIAGGYAANKYFGTKD
jgi:hypothetical protein